MRSATRHVKLGLLTLLAIASLLAVFFALGLRRRSVVTYHTYFDESVQGLDEGAIVKFRGVRVGKVSRIRIAPDHRLIDVGLAIDSDRASGLQLTRNASLLRAQLVIFGITGVKLIDMDFADANTPAPPALSFTPPEHFIPSRPSLLGSVQDDLVTFAHRLPMLADHAIGALDELKFFTLDARGVLADTRAAIHAIGRLARSVSGANVSDSVAKAMAAAAKAMASLDELGQRGIDATADLEGTVRDIRDAARMLRDFLDALEREPDMIVKGRARRR
jgi:hypothetical protein